MCFCAYLANIYIYLKANIFLPDVAESAGNHILYSSSLLSNWYRGSFPGVKQPGCEAVHSHPYSVEIKNGGAIPLLPHMSSWHSA
jgi:hypothetical protein